MYLSFSLSKYFILIEGYETGELMSLEEEMSALAKENSKVESQINQMKAGETLLPSLPGALNTASAMGGLHTAAAEEKENELKRKSAKISSYYENLRSNVFSLLGNNYIFIIDIENDAFNYFTVRSLNPLSFFFQ